MKHFFPGNNTSRGFVNYFEGIIPPWEKINRIYVLKGGPGVGKNTFMHKLEEKTKQGGYQVEYYHCASDCDSLDALKVPELGIVMLDGTAPHIIDPVYPGAVDGIINLGIYLNEEQLAKQVDEIKAYQKKNSACYKKAFAYLKAAGSLAENTDFIYTSALDTAALRKLVKEQLSGMGGSGRAQVRKLFAGAISPQGCVSYIDTIIENEKILKLKGPFAAAVAFMELVMQFCSYEGLDCEVFYAPLLPEKPEHLVIPALSLAITTAIDGEKGTVIDLNEVIDLKQVDEETVAFNQGETEKLIQTAVGSLKQAKSIHDDIEAIYKKSMDFEGSNQAIHSFLQDLF